MKISMLKRSQSIKSLRTPEENDMFEKVDEYDKEQEDIIKKEMAVNEQRSEFKKLWKYQYPKWALFIGVVFSFVSGCTFPT